jgi:hypothetical protein
LGNPSWRIAFAETSRPGNNEYQAYYLSQMIIAEYPAHCCGGWRAEGRFVQHAMFPSHRKSSWQGPFLEAARESAALFMEIIQVR